MRRWLLLAAALVACAPAPSPSPTSTRPPTAAPAVTVVPIEAGEALRLVGFTRAGWKTDFSRRTIDVTEIVSGGPPRDGIPPLDRPSFESVQQAAAWLAPLEPVVYLFLNGEARAYPLQILTWHEIVNDQVGATPVSVTFCPLCNTAIAFDRRLEGRLLDFGTTGNLRRSDLVMWDRQTESWWQQVTGEAIVGALAGQRLAALPAHIVAWEEFRSAHPDGQVLSRETGFNRSYGVNPYVGYDRVDQPPFLFKGPTDGRLPPMERVVALEGPGGPVAYTFSVLKQLRVIQEAGIVVFYRPGTASALDQSRIATSKDVGAAAVYRPDRRRACPDVHVARRGLRRRRDRLALDAARQLRRRTAGGEAARADPARQSVLVRLGGVQARDPDRLLSGLFPWRRPRPSRLDAAVGYKRDFLRQIDIFRDLTQADMGELDAATRMTTARKGKVIYHQEDTAEGLFLLKAGRVRLFRIAPSGKKLDLAVIEPGTFFGEMPLLGERMRNASAEAIEDCTLCVMSQRDVERLILAKPRVGLRMLETVGRRLAQAEARLEDLAYRSVRARLASVLLRLDREGGAEIEGLTHQDLGDMVGAYRETITKILDELERNGVVELARRRIAVRDRARLATLLHE